MVKVRFQPLRIAKRKWRQQWSKSQHNPANDDFRDVEKEEDFEDYGYYNDDASYNSSRGSSNSYGSREAMLGTNISKATASAYAPRRQCNRYFSMILGSILVFLVLFLMQAHYASVRDLQQNNRKPEADTPPWEAFAILERYYGGLRSLVKSTENLPEYPTDGDDIAALLRNATVNTALVTKVSQRTDDYMQPYFSSSRAFHLDTSVKHSLISECFIQNSTFISIPALQVYDRVVSGFPDSIIGSYDVLGLDENVCYDRFGRFGPYGFGYSQKLGGVGAGMEGDTEGASRVWSETPEFDYSEVRWNEVQSACETKNGHRLAKRIASTQPEMLVADSSYVDDALPAREEPEQRLPRTVVLVRTDTDFRYDPEDLLNLRALLIELSLASGAEYTIHFLVQVKDSNTQIWADEGTHQRILEEALPNEFRDMGTLWSERQMGLIYGGIEETYFRDLPVHGSARSSFMPVQYFAHLHPEFDFIWNWEMDVRYTGHFYNLFESVREWAKLQPRKGLWERNSRYYVPSVHGPWEDFKQMVRVQTEHGTGSKSNIWTKLGMQPQEDPSGSKQTVEAPIWGPERPSSDEIDEELVIEPPSSYDKDRFQWGVGEEADLITFNPIFDPESTGWSLAADTSGYSKENPPPLRASVGHTVRLSRRLLNTMHRETALQRHTTSAQMWPSTVALHHGLKAVYAPHPVFVDRRWPPDYLAAVFNGGRNGATGGSRGSVFADARQNNLQGTTWFGDTTFASALWKRWLGFRVDGEGGEEWELANEGRMCLPPILLQSIKQVDLVYEQRD